MFNPQSKSMFEEHVVEMRQNCSPKPRISPVSCWIRAKYWSSETIKEFSSPSRAEYTHTSKSPLAADTPSRHSGFGQKKWGVPMSHSHMHTIAGRNKLLRDAIGKTLLHPQTLSAQLSVTFPLWELPACSVSTFPTTLQQVSAYTIICLTGGSWCAYKLISRSPWGSSVWHTGGC